MKAITKVNSPLTNTKMNFLITLLILSFSDCLYSQVTFTGTAYHSEKQKVWLTNFFGEKCDSAVINPKIPTFILKASIQEESLLVIRCEKNLPYESHQFIVLPGDQIKFSFDAANKDKHLWIKVSGSPFTVERNTEFKNERHFENDIENINKKISAIEKQGGDRSKISGLTARIVEIEKQVNISDKKLLDTTKSVFNAIYVYGKLKKSMQFDIKGRDSLLVVLKYRFPNNKTVQSLNSLTDADIQSIALNTKAPNIILKNTDGIEVDAGKLSYKYLLIDFWASWCKPCREQTPYLLKTYNDFKNKGFKILSLSIDSDSKKWKEAIAADGTFDFIHLDDPAGDKSFYMQHFRVRYIPDNFLIDRNGNIVAKQLYGNKLYNEVSKFINSDK